MQLLWNDRYIVTASGGDIDVHRQGRELPQFR
jgi:hypothetical protein